MLLGELGYWPGQSESVDARLSRAYQDFAFFVKHEWPGKNMQSLKAFTKELFHWPRVTKYPGGRFKGGDCSLMLRWVHHLMLHGFLNCESVPLARSGQSPINAPLQGWHTQILHHILQAASSGVQFFQLLHRGELWLPRATMQEVGMHAAEFTGAFSVLAALCHAKGLPRYHLVPSLHAFHHFWIDSKRATADPEVQHCLTPNVANCEANEDFVGKIARLSRKVHARSTAHRTIERYLVKLWCEWNGIG